MNTAATRLESLVRQVKVGGVGIFEIFLGAPGSGKAEFLRTFHLFFEGVRIEAVENTVPLLDLSKHIKERKDCENRKDDEVIVFVLYDRDSEVLTYEEARVFFERLRILFRENHGQIVIIWPFSDSSAADVLSKAAWDTGRDSIVDVQSKGVFSFEGLSKLTGRIESSG